MLIAMSWSTKLYNIKWWFHIVHIQTSFYSLYVVMTWCESNVCSLEPFLFLVVVCIYSIFFLYIWDESMCTSCGERKLRLEWNLKHVHDWKVPIQYFFLYFLITKTECVCWNRNLKNSCKDFIVEFTAGTAGGRLSTVKIIIWRPAQQPPTFVDVTRQNSFDKNNTLVRCIEHFVFAYLFHGICAEDEYHCHKVNYR